MRLRTASRIKCVPHAQMLEFHQYKNVVATWKRYIFTDDCKNITKAAGVNLPLFIL